jgi:hypothetical protein
VYLSLEMQKLTAVPVAVAVVINTHCVALHGLRTCRARITCSTVHLYSVFRGELCAMQQARIRPAHEEVIWAFRAAAK